MLPDSPLQALRLNRQFVSTSRADQSRAESLLRQLLTTYAYPKPPRVRVNRPRATLPRTLPRSRRPLTRALFRFLRPFYLCAMLEQVRVAALPAQRVAALRAVEPRGRNRPVKRACMRAVKEEEKKSWRDNSSGR